MSKKKQVFRLIDSNKIIEAISSLDGMQSVRVLLDEDGTEIKEIHLLTALKNIQALKAVRTAVYVQTGYLIGKKTLFRVART